MNSFLYQIKLWWLSLDRWIVFSIILLMIIGIFLILSSSSIYANRLDISENYLIKRHLIILPICIFIMIILTNLSVEKIVIFSFIIFSVSLVLSIIPNFVSYEIKGASRWISIYGFSIQPSEFLKPTFVIVTATLLTRFQKKKDNSLKINVFLLSLIGSVLFFQPDFGMFLLILLTWFAQLILFGVSKKIIFLLLFLSLIIIILAYVTLDHVKFRIDNYLQPATGDNYQIHKSIDSFTNGGFFGQGLGAGEVSRFLPDVYSDFILSLAAEELGLICVLIVIILYTFIFYRSIYHSTRKNDIFYFLSISGLAIIFILQTMINICSTLNLIPTKGMTLPFLSYGGSSLISCAILIGFILSLSKIKYEKV